jgi:hypothetical protein
VRVGGRGGRAAGLGTRRRRARGHARLAPAGARRPGPHACVPGLCTMRLRAVQGPERAHTRPVPFPWQPPALSPAPARCRGGAARSLRARARGAQALAPEAGVLFLDLQGPGAAERQAGDTLCNPAEAGVVCQLVAALQSGGVPLDAVGVISPYRSQARRPAGGRARTCAWPVRACGARVCAARPLAPGAGGGFSRHRAGAGCYTPPDRAAARARRSRCCSARPRRAAGAVWRC